MQSRSYKLFNPQIINLEILINDLRQFFIINEHQVQIIPINEGYILQACKESTLSSLMGQSSAVTVRIFQEIDGLRVEIGNTKWLDKAAVGLVGYALLPPLVLLPIVGAFNQYKLTEDIWKKIEGFVAMCNSIDATNIHFTDTICTNCKMPLGAGVMFCSRCGTKVINCQNTSNDGNSISCPSCNLTSPISVKFCSKCGHHFK